RFIGEMGYLVTFKKTDPLFVIELKDPTRPKVLGQLNTTGYSDYLQALDGSHLIGIGKDTVDEGSFAWYQGIKVSLFDVSDPTKPSEVARYVIGDRGSDSLGLRDGNSGVSWFLTIEFRPPFTITSTTTRKRAVTM